MTDNISDDDVRDFDLKAYEDEQAHKDAKIAASIIRYEDRPDHPLAQYRAAPGEIPTEPGWLLIGILCDLVSFIGAYAGAGKTTAIAPLVLVVAGLIEVPGIRIYGWRHVVYISEHPEQLELILAALIKHYDIDPALVWERVKIVSAVKMTATAVAKVSPHYRALSVTHTENGVEREFMPWVIVDTQSSVFEVENENDNAEMSRVVETIKQDMALPVSVIAHTAKVHKRGDVQAMSIRGGGALEGNAMQVLYVSIDPETEQRFIEVSAAKHRFTADCDALAVEYHTTEMTMLDPFDREVRRQVGYCTVEPVAKAQRIERKQDAAEARKREAIKDAREAVLARVVECAKLAKDNPDDPDYYPSKATLEDTLGHPRANVRRAVDELLAEKRIRVNKRPKGIKGGRRDCLVPVSLRLVTSAGMAETDEKGLDE